MSKVEFHCRICGYKNETPPWGEDGKCPEYDFCPCCNVEFGNEDYSLESIKRYRKAWLESGANWSEPEKKPMEWVLENQLKQIPEEYH